MQRRLLAGSGAIELLAAALAAELRAAPIAAPPGVWAARASTAQGAARAEAFAADLKALSPAPTPLTAYAHPGAPPGTAAHQAEDALPACPSGADPNPRHTPLAAALLRALAAASACSRCAGIMLASGALPLAVAALAAARLRDPAAPAALELVSRLLALALAHGAAHGAAHGIVHGTAHGAAPRPATDAAARQAAGGCAAGMAARQAGACARARGDEPGRVCSRPAAAPACLETPGPHTGAAVRCPCVELEPGVRSEAGASTCPSAAACTAPEFGSPLEVPASEGAGAQCKSARAAACTAEAAGACCSEAEAGGPCSVAACASAGPAGAACATAGAAAACCSEAEEGGLRSPAACPFPGSAGGAATTEIAGPAHTDRAPEDAPVGTDAGCAGSGRARAVTSQCGASWQAPPNPAHFPEPTRGLAGALARLVSDALLHGGRAADAALRNRALQLACLLAAGPTFCRGLPNLEPKP